MRSIVRNAIAMLLAYVIPRASMVVAFAIAARVVGAETLGVFGSAAAFAVILSVASTLGMQPLLVREMTRAPEHAADLLAAAHIAKTLANVVMLTVLVLLAVAFGGGIEFVTIALLLGIGYAVGSYAENFGAFFQSREQMHVWAQASAAMGAVAGLGGGLMVLVSRQIVAMAAATLAGQLAALFWLRRSVGRDERSGTSDAPGKWAGALRLLRATVPFALAVIALTLYCKLDVLLLSYWRNEKDVGLYTAAYKFVDLAQALVIVAAAAVLPRLARASSTAAAGASARLIELITLTAIPLAGALLLARLPVVQIMFGSEYRVAAGATGVLAAMLPFTALNISAGYVLGVARAMHLVARAYLLALGVKIALAALLMPVMGVAGAAWCALLAELALTPLMVHGLAQTGIRMSLRTWTLGGTAALLVGALALVPDPSSGIITSGLGVALILMLYRSLHALHANERLALRELFTRGAATDSTTIPVVG